MRTRKQYVAGKCSHREYYGQFVNASTIAAVVRWIGSEDILASNDEHLNDIAMRRWDSAAAFMPMAITFARVGDFRSLAGLLCIAKEAAWQHREAQVCGPCVHRTTRE
jgi:hypothetical protein